MSHGSSFSIGKTCFFYIYTKLYVSNRMPPLALQDDFTEENICMPKFIRFLLNR